MDDVADKGSPPTTTKAEENADVFSAWKPLAESVFRALWIATIVSNLGTWMEDVGEAWLMISLTKSPILIALVETAGSLPVLMLAVPAGALADLVDKRRLLLVTQTWMLFSAAALGVMTLAGVVSPWLLLLLTFILGIGSAVNNPTWSALVPDVIPNSQLPSAITLVSVAINVSRAIGPAIGGLVVAAAGPGVVFLLNAATFLTVIFVVYRWKPVRRKNSAPAERILGAIEAGLRYIRYSPPLRAVYVRTAAFIIFASALWALLPLVARVNLNLGSLGYGVLLGCVGTGAISGAVVLPRVRRSISSNLTVNLATVLFAGEMLILAFVKIPIVTGISLLFGGIAWLAAMTSFNTGVQVASAGWVRARAISVYLLVFMGGLAFGSAIWGAVAARFGLNVALTSAAAGMLLSIAASDRFKLPAGGDLRLLPSSHMADPIVVIEPDPEKGPVLVQTEYWIDPQLEQDFIVAIREMRRIRRRDGATRWGIFSDPAELGRFVETYVVDSWAEHLRQHNRATESDLEAEKRVRAFHVRETPPVTTHLVAEDM